jgi:hypothetical protein
LVRKRQKKGGKKREKRERKHKHMVPILRHLVRIILHKSLWEWGDLNSGANLALVMLDLCEEFLSILFIKLPLKVLLEYL